jgi:hypothetical protein
LELPTRIVQDKAVSAINAASFGAKGFGTTIETASDQFCFLPLKQRGYRCKDKGSQSRIQLNKGRYGGCY